MDRIESNYHYFEATMETFARQTDLDNLQVNIRKEVAILVDTVGSQLQQEFDDKVYKLEEETIRLNKLLKTKLPRDDFKVSYLPLSLPCSKPANAS